MSLCSNACATARSGYVCCVSNCFGKRSRVGSKKLSAGRSVLWMARSSESQARRAANGGSCTASDCRQPEHAQLIGLEPDRSRRRAGRQERERHRGRIPATCCTGAHSYSVPPPEDPVRFYPLLLPRALVLALSLSPALCC